MSQPLRKEESGAPNNDWYETLKHLEDPESFRSFAKHFHGRFYRYFLGRGLPQIDAEDQAAFLITDIILRLEQYVPREGATFEAWMYQWMRNASATWWRKHKTRVDAIEDHPELAGPTADDPDGKASSGQAKTAEAEALEDAMLALSDPDREIIQRCYLEGDLLRDDVALDLGIQPGTARVRLHRALQRLRRLMDRDPRTVRLRQAEAKATKDVKDKEDYESK